VITFAEQVEGLTVRYARRTPPLAEMLTAVGLALAGRAGNVGQNPLGGVESSALSGRFAWCAARS
jgi:hypothetical protein